MDKIGLRVELDDKGAFNQLRDILSAVKQLDGKKIKIAVDNSDLTRIEKSLRAIAILLETVQRKKDIHVGTDSLDLANKKATEFIETLGKAAQHVETNLHLNTSQAHNALDGVDSHVRSLRETFASLGESLSGVGYGIQQFGLGGSDTLGIAKRFATYGILSSFTQNNEAAQSRFDILNTYTDYMNVMGVSSEEAEASLGKLDQAIRGLPIGLDEGAFDIKKYTMYLGDVAKATNLAIGFDQALIAGGAPEQMRSYAKYEVERLLAGGELATSRQWRSLLNGLGISSSVLAKQFGYDRTTDFANALYKKEIASEDFLKALMGIPENEEIQSMIDIYKTTIESGMSNIRFAITRGKANLLKALNETLESSTGKNISDYLYDIRDTIDSLFQSADKWIRANPEKLTSMIQMVKDLFASFKEFNFGQLASDVLGGIQTLFKILNGIYKILPKGALEKIITFMLVWASPIGKMFTALGTVFSIISRFPVVQGAVFKRVMNGMQGMGGVVKSTGKLMTSVKGIGTGFLGASAFLGIIAELGLVIFEFTKIAEVIAKADLDGFWKNFGTVSGFTGIITGVVTAMVGIFSAISGTGFGAVMAGVGELLTAGFVAIIAEFGGAMKVLVSLANDIAGADIPSVTKIQQLGMAFAEMSAAFSNIHLTTTRNQIGKMDDAINLATKVSDSLPKLEAIATTNLDIEAVKTNLGEIMGAFGVLEDSMRDAGWLKKRESSNESDVITNLTEIINNISGVLGTLEGIRSNKLFKRKKGGRFGLEDAIYNVKGVITQIDGLLKEFQEGNTTLALQSYDKRSSKNWAGILENCKTAINNIKEIILTLDSIKFGSLMGSDYGTGAHLPALMENIRTVITEIDQLAADINEGTSRDQSNGQSNFNNLKTKVTALNEAVTQITQAVTALNNIQGAITNLTGKNGTGIGKLFDTIAGEMEGKVIGGDLLNISLMAEVIQRLSDAMSSLGNVDISGFTKAMDDAISKLETFKSKAEELRTALQRVGSTALLTGLLITMMATTIKNKASAFGGMIMSLSLLSFSLRMAASSARSLADAINDIPSYKQVTVNYNRTNSRGAFGGAVSRFFGRFFANGGSVEYLAKGGEPMQPRGTDTIPAMLTAGEYVIRRRSSQILGKRFLDNINNLNIGGAVNELMSRSAMPIGYVDNSRHYDNHATVNQTIHTGNLGNSYRRASRFVSAL